MAWSWVRVSTATSPKLARCLDGDTSSGKVKGCIDRIVRAAGGAFEHGGEVGTIHFEGNGRWARVRFWWEDSEVRRTVIYDLQAEDVVDLISDEERGELQSRDPLDP
jgi:hypothetical protein